MRTLTDKPKDTRTISSPSPRCILVVTPQDFRRLESKRPLALLVLVLLPQLLRLDLPLARCSARVCVRGCLVLRKEWSEHRA